MTIIESREVEKNDVLYTVEFHTDEDMDLSWLGIWTDKDQSYCVDAKLGNILGKEIDEPYDPCDDDYPDTPEGDEQCGKDCYAYYLAYEEWEETPCEILDGYVQIYYERRHTYRYFVPVNPPDGITIDEWIKYTTQDYNRMVGLARGDWSFIGIVAREEGVCSQCGESASLWGIESDSGDAYIDETIDELIKEVSA